MRVLRCNRHLLRDRAQASLMYGGVDYRETNAAVTYADYHTTRHVMVPSQINKISRHHVYILSTVGYFKRKQKNPQAHGYRCSLHPGVFQSIDFPQGT